jgi:hypothetical protein
MRRQHSFSSHVKIRLLSHRLIESALSRADPKELNELKHVNSTQLETDRAIPARPLCRPQPYQKRRSR